MDRYSKTVLTVIAVCLMYFVGKDVVSPAFAQQRVDVNIAAVNGVAFGVLPVRVQP